jgi:hypothetical protein
VNLSYWKAPVDPDAATGAAAPATAPAAQPQP